jgi:hypothetical protein
MNYNEMKAKNDAFCSMSQQRCEKLKAENDAFLLGTSAQKPKPNYSKRILKKSEPTVMDMLLTLAFLLCLARFIYVLFSNGVFCQYSAMGCICIFILQADRHINNRVDKLESYIQEMERSIQTKVTVF